MAAETPVLERKSEEKLRTYNVAQPYSDSVEEEIHNARIRDNYARLINPESKISDIFSANDKKEAVEVKAVVAAKAPARPYLVENARADSALFRADNPINRAQASVGTVNVDELDLEDEDEDLRPTSTTIQYQTIGRTNPNKAINSSANKKGRPLTKKEKLVIAIYVCVIVALLALVVINSYIISGLSANIASVQSDITAVRGALAGVNSSIAELVPESVYNFLIK